MTTLENNKIIAEFIYKGYYVDKEGNIFNSKNLKMKTYITKNI